MSDYVYIGIKPCGHVAAIVVDDPTDRLHTADAVRAWIIDGFAIERATRKDGVERFGQDCSHGQLVEQLKAGAGK